MSALPIESIIEAVQQVCEISRNYHVTPQRMAEYVDARCIAIAFIKDEHPYEPLQAIGKRFGGRDHTTIIHSLRRFEALYATDKRFAQLADRCRERLERMRNEVCLFDKAPHYNWFIA